MKTAGAVLVTMADLRALARWSLAVHVTAVGLGVSVPATAADDFGSRRAVRERPVERREGGERTESPQRRDGPGERGHVRRRGDLIDRSTHVEKREGWRRID